MSNLKNKLIEMVEMYENTDSDVVAEALLDWHTRMEILMLNRLLNHAINDNYVDCSVIQAEIDRLAKAKS